MKKKGINYNLISVMSNREIKEDSVLLIGPVVMHVKLTMYIMYLPFFLGLKLHLLLVMYLIVLRS